MVKHSIGNTIIANTASFAFIVNISTATHTTVKNCGITVVTPLEKSSASELTSPITLARIFPTGLSSKKAKDNF